MSIYGRVKGFLIRNLSLSDPKSWDTHLWNLSGSQSLSGENVTESTALTLSAVYNAISLISGTIGALPLHLMQRKGDKKRLADDRVMYRVLHDEWNPYMTAMAGRECLMAHVLAWGNGYAEKIRNGYGEVVELWPITPDRVRLEMRDNQLTYLVKVDNQDIPLHRDKILHVPGLGFDGFTGYSVIAMARKSIGLSMALETFGANYFGQGTHPGVIVSHPGSLSAQSNSNLKAALTEEYSGLGKSHRLMLLDEAMKIEKISIPPNDSQFLECVVPETLIAMGDGTRKAAKDIRKGEGILAWENGRIVFSRVSAIGKPPLKNLIKIKTARGRELTASEDHPCLAIQKLRTPGCRVPKENPEKWILIKDLKIGSYVRIALGMPLTIEKVMTADEGYFLGAMAGDGYVRKEGCSFTNEDAGVISHIREILESFGGNLKPRPCKYNNFNYEIITNGKRGCKGSYIRSLLNDSGMVGKHSHTKTVPQSVLLGGQDAWKGFLSGYFDTDGSIRKQGEKQTPAMYWSSTSFLMLQECQHLLAMLDIQSAIYPMGNGGTKKIMGKVCKYLPSWGLYIMGVSQIKKAAIQLTLAHVEKAKRLEGYIETKPSRYREENFLYDRIISIEELGEGETIGIEIVGCHTHITNGIVTHNSRQFQIPEVARWFNLPPHKLKDLTKSSFSNIEQEQISFVVDAILPWLVRLEQNFNNQLLTNSDKNLSGHGRLYFKHIVEGLLRGDSASRAAFYGPLLDRGVFCINDVRALEDLDPIPGGDEHFVPLNMVPLSMVKEQFKKKLEAPPATPQLPAPDKNPPPKPGNGKGKEPAVVAQ